MRTQIAIIGAGPAGLLLAHLLHQAGIDSVVIEARAQSYVENRIRAGVLEHHVVDILDQTGLGARMRKEGLEHDGTQFLFGGRLHRIDFKALTGRSVMVYGQHEVVRDLIAARQSTGAPLLFDCTDTAVAGYEQGSPVVTFTHAGQAHSLACELIVGCDGFHGICRPSLPPGSWRSFDRVYPFGWLGILADAPPSADELIYANHERGFALCSMRSTTVQRMYLQCAPDEDASTWSDDRIWSELSVRLACDGFRLREGPVIQKSVTPMRSYVAEPMQCGRLFLAGDAAHIVPPTGAKGMNSAVGDVLLLARAIERWIGAGDEDGLEHYSAVALRRIWKVQRFSWWMTTLFHRFDDASEFDRRVQLAELDYVVGSRDASAALAENYVGLPLMAG